MPRISLIALIGIFTFINISSAQIAPPLCTLPFIPEALVHSLEAGGWFVFAGGRLGTDIRHSKFTRISRKSALVTPGLEDAEPKDSAATAAMFPGLKRFDVVFSSPNRISFLDGEFITHYQWQPTGTFRLLESYRHPFSKNITDIQAASWLGNPKKNLLVIGKSTADGMYHDFILDENMNLVPDGVHPAYPDGAPIPTSLTAVRDHPEEQHTDMLMFYKAFVGTIGYDYETDRVHVARPLLFTWKSMRRWMGCATTFCFDGDLDGAAVSNYHAADSGNSTIHLFRGPFYYGWNLTKSEGFGPNLPANPTKVINTIPDEWVSSQSFTA